MMSLYNVPNVIAQYELTRTGDMTNTEMSTVEWMVNIIEALEETEQPLQHVYFTEGTAEADLLMRFWRGYNINQARCDTVRDLFYQTSTWKCLITILDLCCRHQVLW
jgi:hypothetical protein